MGNTQALNQPGGSSPPLATPPYSPATPLPSVRVGSFPNGNPYGSFPDPLVPGVGALPQPKFNALWKQALAQAKTRTVNMYHWAASIGGGAALLSSNWATKGISALMVGYLQALYGDGGSGFISTALVNGSGGATYYASSVTASGAGGTTVGGWDNVLGAGVNAYYLFPHVASSGVTLTDTNVRGTTIDILSVATVTASTTFQYSIDGGAAVTVNTTVGATANNGIITTTITGLSAGPHTLVLTANAGQASIIGWCGRNATGVLPIYMSRPGRSSGEAQFSNAFIQGGLTAGQASLNPGLNQTGGQTFPWGTPDMLLVSDMGINDAGGANIFTISGVVNSPPPVQNFTGNVEYLFNQALAANPNCALACHMMHRGTLTDPASHTVTVSTTSGSAAITVTAGTLTEYDDGMVVTGTGIPTQTYLTITGPTTATLSKNATATNAGVTMTIIPPNPMYGSYCGAMRGLCDSFGAHLFNFWNVGNNNNTTFQNASLWGNSASIGNPGTDIVHPDDKGHAFLASLAIPWLVPT